MSKKEIFKIGSHVGMSGKDMFLFNSSDYWNDEEKMKEFREINTKISKLTSKIREISTEIFRYDIYPF